MTETPRRPRFAALVGPTASGKTALALALGERLAIEIVSCDSAQVYRGLDAATAKPTPEERARVPHHLVDVCEPTDPMSAGRWARLAEEAIADVAARGRLPLVVGGTGLYLRALRGGLDEIPAVPEGVRATLEAEADAIGLAALHAELGRVDPAYAARTPPANRQRVVRALEVYRATGRPFSSFHGARHDGEAGRAFVALLMPPPDVLDRRLQARAAAMVASLLSEAARLRAHRLGVDTRAIQALGYVDALACLDGAIDRQTLSVRLLRQHRAYARRQRTWFRVEPADLLLRDQKVDLLYAALLAWRDGAR